MLKILTAPYETKKGPISEALEMPTIPLRVP
jgi:hypothetical protein